MPNYIRSLTGMQAALLRKKLFLKCGFKIAWAVSVVSSAVVIMAVV